MLGIQPHQTAVGRYLDKSETIAAEKEQICSAGIAKLKHGVAHTSARRHSEYRGC